MELISIDKRNWEEAAKLEVRDDQASFVLPNVWSIAEAQFYPWIEPYAIFDGNQMVGFLVYGRDPSDGRYWLYRFMIDRHFQGRGFGTRALTTLLERLRALPDCRAVSVGFQADNLAAERLYLAAGFVKGPPAPWGEETATFVFDSAS